MPTIRTMPFSKFPKKYIHWTWGLLLFSLFGGSCSRWNLGDAGPNTTVTRSITGTGILRIGQKFDVILQQDTTRPESYTLEYPEKLIPNIIHEFKNGALTVSDENRGKWTQDLSLRPKIILNLHQYHTLYIEGSSQWSCSDTLMGNTLNIEMRSVLDNHLWIDFNQVSGKCNNLGSLTLRGRGTIFSFSVEAGSQLDAQNMRCHDAYFWHFTQRDCYVSPEKQAFLYLYNSGNLTVKSTEFYRFESLQKGSGRIIYTP